jgi:hypothetical protein
MVTWATRRSGLWKRSRDVWRTSRQWLSGPPLSSSSIHHVHAPLRTSLNEAVRRGHIAKNPVLIAKALGSGMW